MDWHRTHISLLLWAFLTKIKQWKILVSIVTECLTHCQTLCDMKLVSIVFRTEAMDQIMMKKTGRNKIDGKESIEY